MTFDTEKVKATSSQQVTVLHLLTLKIKKIPKDLDRICFRNRAESAFTKRRTKTEEKTEPYKLVKEAIANNQLRVMEL